MPSVKFSSVPLSTEPSSSKDNSKKRRSYKGIEEYRCALEEKCNDVLEYLEEVKGLIEEYEEKNSTLLDKYKTNFLDKARNVRVASQLLKNIANINESDDEDIKSIKQKFCGHIQGFVTVVYQEIIKIYNKEFVKRLRNEFENWKKVTGSVGQKILKMQEMQKTLIETLFDEKKLTIIDEQLKSEIVSDLDMQRRYFGWFGGYRSSQIHDSSKNVNKYIVKQERFLKEEDDKDYPYFIEKATRLLYHGRGSLSFFKGPVFDLHPTDAFFYNLNPFLNKHHFLAPSLEKDLTKEEKQILGSGLSKEELALLKNGLTSAEKEILRKKTEQLSEEEKPLRESADEKKQKIELAIKKQGILEMKKQIDKENNERKQETRKCLNQAAADTMD